jgi:hypothetical protein
MVTFSVQGERQRQTLRTKARRLVMYRAGRSARIVLIGILTTGLDAPLVYGAGAAGEPGTLQGRVAPPPNAASAPTAGPAGGEKPAVVVKAPDSPVQLDKATVFTTADAPPVVLYSVTNLTTDALDQFTLVAFVFNAEGTLKAMQIAPGRRTLNPKETKYSSMVLDGAPIAATDSIVVGINQTQRVDSDAWWRADLQPAAQDTQRKTPPAR